MEHILGKECDVSQSDNNKNCPLCFARGFICEICRSEDIIFPFQPELEVNNNISNHLGFIQKEWCEPYIISAILYFVDFL